MNPQSNQRGDTLVEVTIALAILVMVLLSSFNLASYAFRLGEQAKERTQASQLAQEQAEALRNYRDNHPWLNNGVPTTCDDLKMGFYSNVQSAGCQTNHEFHFFIKPVIHQQTSCRILGRLLRIDNKVWSKINFVFTQDFYSSLK